MEKKVTSLFFTVRRFSGRRLFLFLTVLLLFSAGVFAQSTGDQMGFGDLSDINWKAASELNQTLADEHAKMDLALTQPQLPDSDRALFLSYKRLLDYMELDIQAGKPVEELLPQNYEKVVLEAPKDPVLKHLNTDVFITLMPGLIEALAEVPVPAFGQ